jgi:hypothetical protein
VDSVRKIADAVLYEGYILWPYRRSALKNSQRWTFGGVYPRAWSEAGHDDDRWRIRTECRFRGEARDLDVRVRFLHVVRRQLMLGDEPVDELEVGGERYLSWEEAREREVGEGPIAIDAGSEREELGGDAAIVRSWQALEGRVDVQIEDDRIRILVDNATPFGGGGREEAQASAFCSTHTVLRGPEFVSMTESEGCENDGTWPVLVEDGRTMLSSPIILEDFPQIAPESPGDLFDGGEIDQLLTLNILSLTDEEKAEMRASDPRAREILERTEALTQEELMSLHGSVRQLQVRR